MSKNWVDSLMMGMIVNICQEALMYIYSAMCMYACCGVQLLELPVLWRNLCTYSNSKLTSKSKEGLTFTR